MKKNNPKKLRKHPEEKVNQNDEIVGDIEESEKHSDTFKIKLYMLV